MPLPHFELHSPAFLKLLKRYKILFLASWFPNRIKPALGNFIQRHAEAVALFNDVGVLHVCPDEKLAPGTFETEAVTINGVYVVNVYFGAVKSTFPVYSHLNKLKTYYTAYKKGYENIYRHFKSHPSLVHLNVMLPAGLFARWLLEKHGIPYVISEHSSMFNTKMSWLNRMFVRYIGNKSMLLCPVSDSLGKAIQRVGVKKEYKAVPNVVNTSLFKIGSANNSGKKRILHVSTLDDEVKNISGILRAVKKVSASRDDFELHIISELDPAYAMSQAKKTGVDDRLIKWQTFMPIEKVAIEMQQASFFLLFSNTENLPCVLIESLSCGVPVLATRVGGIPEIIDESRGVLIPPRDENALAEKINFMLDHHLEYDKVALSKYASENFSYEAVGRKLQDIYDKVPG